MLSHQVTQEPNFICLIENEMKMVNQRNKQKIQLWLMKVLAKSNVNSVASHYNDTKSL